MIDLAAGGEAVAAKLLHFLGPVFEWWRRHEAGSVARPTLRSYVARLEPVVRSLRWSRARGAAAPGRRRCAGSRWTGFAHLWTFATCEGVPPRNKAAERAPRHGVI